MTGDHHKSIWLHAFTLIVISLAAGLCGAQERIAVPPSELFGEHGSATADGPPLMIGSVLAAGQWTDESDLPPPLGLESGLSDSQFSDAQFSELPRAIESPLPTLLSEREPTRGALFGIPGRRCLHCGASSQQDGFAARGIGVCEACGHDVQGRPAFGPHAAFRLGWWATVTDGSDVKIGEFQDLSSAPFWEWDEVWSNGARTLDVTVAGLDSEANDVRGYFYGPLLSLDVDYQRFLRRLDHLPPPGFDLNSGAPSATDKVTSEDLNVGEDYAIRVQQLDTTVKGKLGKNLKWKVNLWAMRKSGERQAAAMAHCFNVNSAPAADFYTCHVLSQRQRIDWTTVEVTPSVETRIGRANLEYSRSMRAFGQNDQVVDRTYTAFDFSPSFGSPGPDFASGWVPETLTQTDRLRWSGPINDNNQLYSHVYFGNTENKFRDTRRRFGGLDLRLTNRAIEDVKLVAYTKVDVQRNELPSEFLTTPPFGVNTGSSGTFEPSSLRHPVDYTGARAGIKGNWLTPSTNWLSATAGYEFHELGREYAQYDTVLGTFAQEDTQRHQIHFGPYFRVSPKVDAYVRYKGGFIDEPLIGVRPADGKLNTNQPQQVHRIELGSTWRPTANFVATSMFGIENSWHESEYACFNEDNYPILFTLWYAPTPCLSLTTGYAFLSNWIDQDITIGFLDNPTESSRWDYRGYSNLVNGQVSYSYTAKTRLVGGFEWNQGRNSFYTPPSTAGADWSLLPTFSDVEVRTTRLNFGLDYQYNPQWSSYFRYSHFDYESLASELDSGTLDMFLFGLLILR